MFTIKLENGKYEVFCKNDDSLIVHRYGAPWRVLTGDKLVLALCQRIIELEEQIEDTGHQ